MAFAIQAAYLSRQPAAFMDWYLKGLEWNHPLPRLMAVQGMGWAEGSDVNRVTAALEGVLAETPLDPDLERAATQSLRQIAHRRQASVRSSST